MISTGTETLKTTRTRTLAGLGICPVCRKQFVIVNQNGEITLLEHINFHTKERCEGSLGHKNKSELTAIPFEVTEQLVVKENCEVVLLTLCRDLVLGHATLVLRNWIRDVAKFSHGAIVVLNFEYVPKVDSAGIGEIVAGLTTVKETGGDLIICAITEKFRKKLEITNLLNTAVRVFENKEKAIASFK